MKHMRGELTSERRGELTSQQIVTLLVLVVSFTILLFFLYELNLKSDISKEACRNSVVLRASAPLGKETVKLQCKTQGKLCCLKAIQLSIFGPTAILSPNPACGRRRAREASLLCCQTAACTSQG